MKRISKLMVLASACAVSIGGTILAPDAPAQAIPVFDATNYAQNLLQAARALEQVNHQIQSLQNEASMLRNMARNLERIDFPELEKISASLGEIDRLMDKAQGIGFRVDQIEERFRAAFPGSIEKAIGTDHLAAEAKARLEDAFEDLRHSMSVQGAIVSNIHDDAELLAELSRRSEASLGSLQAQQATNQLLALSAKQQLQLQAMMAAEFRSASTERARRAQAKADARAAAKRFLGSGKAYMPAE